jgi:hypothetical protein
MDGEECNQTLRADRQINLSSARHELETAKEHERDHSGLLAFGSIVPRLRRCLPFGLSRPQGRSESFRHSNRSCLLGARL